MNYRRLAVAAALAYAVVLVVDFVVGLTGFDETYRVWVTNNPRDRMALFATEACFVAALSFIYAKGIEPRRSALGQSLRFAVAIFMLISTPWLLRSLLGTLGLDWYQTRWAMATAIRVLATSVTIGLVYRTA